MNLWTMIVLIVAICVISDIIKSRNNGVNVSEKSNEDVSRILACLKKRVENLETIVLERERTKRFAGTD